MKKSVQQEINKICLQAIDDFNNYHDSLTPEQIDSAKVNRLRYCKAWVVTYERYYVLTSYNTRVAFIDRETGEAFDVLRYVYGYTATSAQHIRKFFHDYSWSGYYPETVHTYR